MPERDLDELLGQTLRPLRRQHVRPPAIPRTPLPLWFRAWASSQVSAYRLGLVLVYLGIMYFGASAFAAGIPAFEFTTPGNWWTPMWAVIVVLGGCVAAIGAVKAGADPVTKQVRVFNRIELGGAIAVFLTLGTYAAVLLVLGYWFGDSSRVAVGAGFVALGIHPAVRMFWLIFRPSKKHVEVTTGTTLAQPQETTLPADREP